MAFHPSLPYRQYGRTEAKGDGGVQIQGNYRKAARTLVGPVAKKVFALKGAYDPAAKVDLSLVPDLEVPASFKSEVRHCEIFRQCQPF